MEFGPIVRSLARNRMRVLLIVLQIAITLAVIVNATTMISAERTKMRTERLLTLGVRMLKVLAAMWPS